MKWDQISGEPMVRSIDESIPIYLLHASDYPYTTVPNQVQRIFRAQLLHDKKHYDERWNADTTTRAKMPYVDYLRPIIADGDTGYAFDCDSWNKVDSKAP